MKILDWQLVETFTGWEVLTPNALGALIGSGLTKQAALQDTISRLEGTLKELRDKWRKELA